MADSITVLQAQVGILDPHVVNDNADSLNVLNALFEPLVLRGPQGYRPCLATSWHLTEDARTWTFQLRPDVTFHDGASLAVEDVVASVDRARAADVGGVLGTEGLFHSYLGDMTLEMLDRHAVRMTTAEPMADLLDLLVDIPILPASRMREPLRHPVGSGPFRLRDRSEQELVMVAHADHWRARPAPFNEVTWRTESDPVLRLERLRRAEADLVTNLTHEAVSRIQDRDPALPVIAPSHVCTVFMCNLRQGVCTDSRVRQALNFGFDHQSLIDRAAHGAAQPLNGPLTPRHMGHDPDLAPYPHDPVRARRLLADAGYGGGMDLVLDVPAELPDEAELLAALLSEQYARIGIETRIRVHHDRPAYAQRVKAKDIHDACCFDSSPLSSFRSLREKFHAGVQGPWWLGYRNGQVDRLLSRAWATVDYSQRQALYRQAYRHLHADPPWIYLYHHANRWAVSPRLAHWRPTMAGLIDLT